MTSRQLERELASRFGSVTSSSGGNGLELLVDCPHCGRHKLSVNPSKGVFQCWHCHESGTLYRLLGRRIELDQEAVAEMKARERRRAAMAAAGCASPGDTTPLEDLPEENEAILYIKSRKFDPVRLSRVFGLSYCLKGRKFGGGVFDTSGTIVIPVVENGRQIAWQSRLLYDLDDVRPGQEAAYGWKKEGDGYVKPPKYFTSPGFRKGEHFFNFDLASRNRFVVVTEGAFDAMRVGGCAVAAFGKNLTDTQVQLLRDRWSLVILLLDPDAESDQGKLEARITGAGMFGGNSSGVQCLPVKLYGYKDAGEAPQKEVVRQILAAASARGIDLRKYATSNPF